MDRRDFLNSLKNVGVVAVGKTAGLDNFAESFKSNVFPEIQENLKATAWNGRRSYDNLYKKYYLTNAQWSDKNAPQAERTKIRESFYKKIDALALAHHNKTKIPKDIYVMMAAKESNFGTSYLAQIAGNPFSINAVGKKEPLGTNIPTIKWNDDDTVYDFYHFKSLEEAFNAFDKLFEFWKDRSEYKRLDEINPDQAINLLARPHTWGAGKGGAVSDYLEWLNRVKNRKY